MSAFGYDVILLLELLMQGDFAKVPEPLFSFRILNEAKTAADYQQDFQSAAPAPKTPYAGMAKNLLKTVYQAPLSSTEKAEVFADFIQTLTRENPPWREHHGGIARGGRQAGGFAIRVLAGTDAEWSRAVG